MSVNIDSHLKGEMINIENHVSCHPFWTRSGNPGGSRFKSLLFAVLIEYFYFHLLYLLFSFKSFLSAAAVKLLSLKYSWTSWLFLQIISAILSLFSSKIFTFGFIAYTWFKVKRHSKERKFLTNQNAYKSKLPQSHEYWLRPFHGNCVNKRVTENDYSRA